MSDAKKLTRDAIASRARRSLPRGQVWPANNPLQAVSGSPTPGHQHNTRINDITGKAVIGFPSAVIGAMQT